VSNGKLEYSRGDVLASKYEVTDRLGDTPLGVTYRVKHLKSGKFVRLTVLRPEVMDATTPEALRETFRSAKDLRNPHIVRLGELGEHNGASFFTWEDFESKSLLELMQEYKVGGKRFALKDAAQVINQVLEALATLHEEGVFFRALRPEHILVNVRYAGPRQQNFVAHVKLFGACLWDLVPTSYLVEDEYTRGDAQYLAPELKSFDPVASMRSDIYSAGVVFYHMLSGSAPVGTFMPLTQQRPELPKLVDDVVELAMAHSPDDRYRSARDLSSGIQRVIESAATEPQEEARTGPLVLAIAGIGAVLVLAVAVGVYALVNSDSTKSAQVEDQEVRLSVREQHTRPTDAERQAMQDRHPKGMIYVPPGPFVTGRLNHDPFANKGAAPARDRRARGLHDRRLRVPQRAQRHAGRQGDLAAGPAAVPGPGQAPVHGPGVGEGLQGSAELHLQLRRHLRPGLLRRRADRRLEERPVRRLPQWLGRVRHVRRAEGVDGHRSRRRPQPAHGQGRPALERREGQPLRLQHRRVHRLRPPHPVLPLLPRRRRLASADARGHTRHRHRRRCLGRVRSGRDAPDYRSGHSLSLATGPGVTTLITLGSPS